MDSDLEEGEIKDEGEERAALLAAQTFKKAGGRKNRKKTTSVGKNSAVNQSGVQRKTRMRNGIDYHIVRTLSQIGRKSTRKGGGSTGKRRVEAVAESSSSVGSRLVISVNNNADRSTKASCDSKGTHPTERIKPAYLPGPKWKPLKPANNNTRSRKHESSKQTTDVGHLSNVSGSSDEDDDTRSIISLDPPPKSPPELIVLDSEDSNNDEDVELLQLRKLALQGLMAKLSDEAAGSVPPEHKDEDEPYSPPDDDFRRSQNNIENITPDESDKTVFPSVYQPPASFLPLREPNLVGTCESSSFEKPPLPPDEPPLPPAPTQNFVNSASTFPPFPGSLYPQFSATGDVDMRVLGTAPNPVAPPVTNMAQYPLFQTSNSQIPSSSFSQSSVLPDGTSMGSSIHYGFSVPEQRAPSLPPYHLSNFNMDSTRPWNQFQPVPQQQNMTPFGLAQNIVLPTPSFQATGLEALCGLSVTRIARSTLYPEVAQPATIPKVPSTDSSAPPPPPSGPFRQDVDDRSTLPPPKAYISPPASPPPEETGKPIPPIERSPPMKIARRRSKTPQPRDLSKSKDSRSHGVQRRSSKRLDGRSRESESKARRVSSRRRDSQISSRITLSRRRSSPSPERDRRYADDKSSDRPKPDDTLPERPSENIAKIICQPETLETGNIVISVCNEKAVPPPAPPPPPHSAQPTPPLNLDDSINEDEDVLRTKLLLDIAKKKIRSAADAATPPTSTVPIVAPSSVKPTLTTTTASASSIPSLPFPLKGTGSTITKTITNPRSKNRQFLRVVNNGTSLPTNSNTVGPNLTLRKTINNPTKPVRPNLQSIQRTIINTNLLKQNVYNKNADPLMRHLKITVPNKVITPLIIPAGGDSSTDDESSEGNSPIKEKPVTVPVRASTPKKPPTGKGPLPVGFEDSLNNLLSRSREQAKPPAPTPPMLKHLPLDKQAEYLRLKSQIEQHERRIQKKLARLEAEKSGASLRSPSQNPILRTSTPPSKPLENQSRTTSNAPFTQISISASITPPVKTSAPHPVNGAAAKTPDISKKTAETPAETVKAVPVPLVNPNTTKIPPETSGTSAVTSKIIAAVALVPSNSVSTEAIPTTTTTLTEPNTEVDLILKDIFESSSADEDGTHNSTISEVNEDKLLATDDEADDDVDVDHNENRTEQRSSVEMVVPDGDQEKPGLMFRVEERPHVLDAAKEREELYMRERLLKAALLKKMQASDEALKLRKLEQEVLTSRKKINLELTSLLSEMVKISDLKVKMKSQEEKVLRLREELYAAEQQLSSTGAKIQTKEARRKAHTARVIAMRKACVQVIKQCKEQGQKVQENYRVPPSGAPEMKLKLMEVRSQNLVFRREDQKLKMSPRKLPASFKKSQLQLSATLMAAHRVKRSFHHLMYKRPAHHSHGTRPTPGSSAAHQLRLAGSRKTSMSRGLNSRMVRYMNTNTPSALLTRHDEDSAEDWDEQSVFLLPRVNFKDVLAQDEPKSLARNQIFILPYTPYESPLSAIRESQSSSSSDGSFTTTPGLVRNLDPFVSLCYFELRGMCNSVKCAFQHLYRPSRKVSQK